MINKSPYNRLAAVCLSALLPVFAFSGTASALQRPDNDNLYLVAGPVTEDPEEMYRHYIPWIEFLEKETGISISMQFPADEGDLRKKMSEEYYDIVFLPPHLYGLTAGPGTGYRPVLELLYEGTPFEEISLLTPSSSDIYRPADLEGKTVLFTAGNCPEYFPRIKDILEAHGLEDGKYNIRRVSSHARAEEAMLGGSAEAICLRTQKGRTLPSCGTGEAGISKDIRTLAIIHTLPAPLLCFSSYFVSRDSEIADKLRKTLLSMRQNPAGAAILRYLSSSGLESSYAEPDRNVYEGYVRSLKTSR